MVVQNHTLFVHLKQYELLKILKTDFLGFGDHIHQSWNFFEFQEWKSRIETQAQ